MVQSWLILVESLDPLHFLGSKIGSSIKTLKNIMIFEWEEKLPLGATEYREKVDFVICFVLVLIKQFNTIFCALSCLLLIKQLNTYSPALHYTSRLFSVHYCRSWNLLFKIGCLTCYPLNIYWHINLYLFLSTSDNGRKV